jgi:hypothetical protein
MERVALLFATDADVQAVCAEALMCLAPWELYESDLTPKPIGLRVKAALDRGLQASPTHIWLCHLKVHYSEMGYAHRTRTVGALSMRNIMRTVYAAGRSTPSTGTRPTPCAARVSRQAT